MNKQDFLNELNQRLELLDPKERRELLSDYQEHFRNGIDAGKSEEQIVFDLGTPEEIATDILSERNIREEQVEAEYYYVPRKNQNANRSVSKQILIGVGLFFLDICLIIPIMVSLWSLVISLWATVGSFLLSPVLLGVMLLFGADFEFYQMFVSIGLVGLGLMLLFVASALTKVTTKATMAIIHWHKYAVKGGGNNA
ncbi:DUF1700 domain-containing protein [Listeria cossartiae subsp. cayugensis]|uniref:DUF1700 domain-containing protein n=1 Tax=Listeria cossartiae subsp. cayugensis TaxID=2713505 RepID=A0ABU2ILS7_9LIST|nr:DUF1700 domain-containing protein [Listeria cossartiae]MDT0049146.1 DUF1700 domain-containing protein [Listeria cossartiae subsp. cayugensis]MDT0065649.1 DUF1700 domain-containing protein [Listeria cossartiae subsp. cayugensis]MDT0078747.1 DUF1700 domain-containing protein [Listeria cossartiae subsp. cayugensis]MDT0081583.1 DUF1700 domain-containing protein [Listeria cossartiae subsp. cayugensis]MDT0087882.1 DUF1700 domain-containing protein [Listeria cossartiae subsp. cayugensis]